MCISSNITFKTTNYWDQAKTWFNSHPCRHYMMSCDVISDSFFSLSPSPMLSLLPPLFLCLLSSLSLQQDSEELLMLESCSVIG